MAMDRMKYIRTDKTQTNADRGRQIPRTIKKGWLDTMATMISRNEAENTVNAWNARINNFMNDELPELLKSEGIQVKNGKIKMNDWFKAQTIINRQNFYEIGHAIQVELRNAGHDVKMNMQDHTLVLY